MFAHLTPRERMAYFGLALLFIFSACFVGARNMQPVAPMEIRAGTEAIGDSKPTGLAKPTEVVPPKTEVVDVAGAVMHPQVVHLPADSRVAEAIKVCGGFAADADRERLNLAAKLVDGTQVFVPRKAKASDVVAEAYRGGTQEGSLVYGNTTVAGLVSSSPSKGKAKRAPPRPLDINSASATDLQQIPGIGPSTADRIVQFRNEHGPFASIEDLRLMGGIGDKKLEKIRPWVFTNH